MSTHNGEPWPGFFERTSFIQDLLGEPQMSKCRQAIENPFEEECPSINSGTLPESLSINEVSPHAHSSVNIIDQSYLTTNVNYTYPSLHIMDDADIQVCDSYYTARELETILNEYRALADRVEELEAHMVNQARLSTTPSETDFTSLSDEVQKVHDGWKNGKA